MPISAAAIEESRPDEIYNLARPELRRRLFRAAAVHSDVDALGALRMLEAIRSVNRDDPASIRPRPRKCSARCRRSPQSESTPFYPRSPYGVAKVYAHGSPSITARAYGLFACTASCSIMKPAARHEFVTRKITAGAGAHQTGLQERRARQSRSPARLGLCRRLCRWHVADAAAEKPDDYVLATGETTACANSASSRPRRSASTSSGRARPGDQRHRPAVGQGDHPRQPEILPARRGRGPDR